MKYKDQNLCEAIDYYLFLYQQKYSEGDIVGALYLLTAIGVLIASLSENKPRLSE